MTAGLALLLMSPFGGDEAGQAMGNVVAVLSLIYLASMVGIALVIVLVIILVRKHAEKKKREQPERPGVPDEK